MKVITSGCTGHVIINKNAEKFIDFNSMYWVKELFILNYLNKHCLENVPKLLEYAFLFDKKPKTGKEYYYTKLVMEKYDKLLLDYSPKNDMDLLQILIDLVSAIKTMHSLNIWHRDLKMDNIMVKNGRAYFIDFSHSYYKKTTNILLETSISTYGYQAPEVTKYIEDPFINTYDNKQDIWSLGIIFLELVTDTDIYKVLDEDTEEYYNEFYQKEDFKQKIIDHYDNKKCSYFELEYKDIILSMLEQNPENRICAESLYKKLIEMINCKNLEITLNLEKYDVSEKQDNVSEKNKLILIPHNNVYISNIDTKKQLNDIFDNQKLEDIFANNENMRFIENIWNINYDYICYVINRCHFKIKYTTVFKFLYTLKNKYNNYKLTKSMIFSILLLLNVFIADDIKTLNYLIVILNLNGDTVRENIVSLIQNNIDVFLYLDFYNNNDDFFKQMGYTPDKFDSLIKKEELLEEKINAVNKIFDSYIDAKRGRSS